MTLAYDEMLATIPEIAESWEGTPYIYGACVKGKGVDCARFIMAVYQKAGFVPPGYRTPHQHREWHYGKHVDKDVFVREILKFSHKISPDDIQPGDVISFLYNGIESHLAIVVGDGCIIHAVSGSRVKKQLLRTLNNICSVYRVNGI